jgi:hypothetical protein
MKFDDSDTLYKARIWVFALVFGKNNVLLHRGKNNFHSEGNPFLCVQQRGLYLKKSSNYTIFIRVGGIII